MSKKPESKKRKDNPGCYVAKAECAQISGGIKDTLKKIELALFGEDGRGGMVKDVADIKNSVAAIKKERSTLLEIVKCIAVPIVVAVVTALILSHPWT